MVRIDDALSNRIKLEKKRRYRNTFFGVIALFALVVLLCEHFIIGVAFYQGGVLQGEDGLPPSSLLFYNKIVKEYSDKSLIIVKDKKADTTVVEYGAIYNKNKTTDTIYQGKVFIYIGIGGLINK